MKTPPPGNRVEKQKPSPSPRTKAKTLMPPPRNGSPQKTSSERTRVVTPIKIVFKAFRPNPAKKGPAAQCAILAKKV